MENPLVFVAHLGKCVFIEEVDAVHRIVQDMRGERHSVRADQIQTEAPADPVAATDTAHDQYTGQDMGAQMAAAEGSTQGGA